MTELQKGREFLKEIEEGGSAVFLMEDSADTYWPIGASRLEEKFFVFFVAGGDNQQHEHVVHFDEAKLDPPHFLSFLRDGKSLGGVCALDPYQLEECRWERYRAFLRSEDGQVYKASIEERVDEIKIEVLNRKGG